jgi:hypothetical protein
MSQLTPWPSCMTCQEESPTFENQKRAFKITSHGEWMTSSGFASVRTRYEERLPLESRDRLNEKHTVEKLDKIA